LKEAEIHSKKNVKRSGHGENTIEIADRDFRKNDLLAMTAGNRASLFPVTWNIGTFLFPESMTPGDTLTPSPDKGRAGEGFVFLALLVESDLY
jgi:hypothetical protein